MATDGMDEAMKEEIRENTLGISLEYQPLVQEVIRHTLQHEPDVGLALLAQYEPVIHQLHNLDPEYVPLVLNAVKDVYTRNPRLAYWYFRNSPATLEATPTLTLDIFLLNSLREPGEAQQIIDLIDLKHHGNQYYIKIQQLARKAAPQVPQDRR